MVIAVAIIAAIRLAREPRDKHTIAKGDVRRRREYRAGEDDSESNRGLTCRLGLELDE